MTSYIDSSAILRGIGNNKTSFNPSPASPFDIDASPGIQRPVFRDKIIDHCDTVIVGKDSASSVVGAVGCDNITFQCNACFYAADPAASTRASTAAGVIIMYIIVRD